jgi:lipoprotein Spr
MKQGKPLLSLFLAATAAAMLLSSCHSSKKAAKSPAPESQQTSYTSGSNPLSGGKHKKSKQANQPGTAAAPNKDNELAKKYAALLGVSKKDITNYDLYKFIDEWYSVPYKFAGRTKAGVDCSDLASLLFKQIYGITIGGTVTDIYKRCTPIKAAELQEGDLIFFKIKSKSLSHVGIYLQNHKFVHASVHAGVVISDLGEDYYKKYYWGAGRLIKNEK